MQLVSPACTHERMERPLTLDKQPWCVAQDYEKMVSAQYREITIQAEAAGLNNDMRGKHEMEAQLADHTLMSSITFETFSHWWRHYQKMKRRDAYRNALQMFERVDNKKKGLTQGAFQRVSYPISLVRGPNPGTTNIIRWCQTLTPSPRVRAALGKNAPTVRLGI